MDDVEKQIRGRERLLVIDRERLVDDLAGLPDALVEEALPRPHLRMRQAEAEPVARACPGVRECHRRLQPAAVPAQRLGVLAHRLPERTFLAYEIHLLRRLA